MVKLVKQTIKKALAYTPYTMGLRERLAPDPFEWCARGLVSSDTTGPLMDVGANSGETMVRLARMFPHATIHSFEPAQEPYGLLLDNAKGCSRIHCHRLAVGGSEGEVVLHKNSADVTNSILVSTRDAIKYSPAGWTVPVADEVVPMVTVDGFCLRNRIRQVELLKIDCQGVDHEVLNGAATMLSGHAIRTLLFEANFVPLYEGQGRFEDMCMLLRNYGYRFLGMYQQMGLPHSQIGWGDALFTVE